MTENQAVREASKEECYGIIFCKAGKETNVADAIKRLWPEITAMPAKAWKRKSRNGKKYYNVEVVIQGYVFIRGPADFVPITRPTDMFFFLKTEEYGWHLFGEDRKFAEWLLAHDGEFGVSKAYHDGERVKILDGPLKEFEGHIVKIDKRSRNAQVKLCINQKYVYLWLSFELMETLDGEKPPIR